MNQESLANSLGLTFQQVQKYEGGANRVSASRLQQMSTILDVPIDFFFAGLRPDGEAPKDHAEHELREHMERPETIELVRSYYRIADPELRAQFLEMVKKASE